MTFTYPQGQPDTDTPITLDATLETNVTATVYRKLRWADAWTEEPKFDVISLNWTASPTVPTATIRYRYGRVVEMGASSETTRAKFAELRGWYIKIVVHCTDGDRPWWGFVDEDVDEQHGVIKRVYPDPEEEGSFIVVWEAHGIQSFICLGMIAALDRAQINRTYFKVTTAFSNSGEDLIRVAYSPPMFNVVPNSKKKVDRYGNRRMPPSRSHVDYPVPTFTADEEVPTDNLRDAFVHWYIGLYGYQSTTSPGPDLWTLKNVLEYLVAYDAPRVGETDDDPSEFVPVWIYNANYAVDYYPELDTEGLTLKGALDRLLRHENGQGYIVWVDESSTPHRVYVEPYTTLLADQEIEIDVDTTINFPKNARQIVIIGGTDAATAITTQTNAATNYSAIAVRGAAPIVVCTIDPDTKLENGWSSALQTAYDTEIAGLNTNILRELYRMRDIREQGKYRPIGRNFVAKYNWDFKITADDLDLFTDRSDARYLPFPLRMRFMDYLPLKESVDYTEDDSEALTTAHDGAKSVYRRIEAYAKSFATDGTLTGKKTCWSRKAIRDIIYDMTDPAFRLNLQELAHEMAFGLEINVDGAFQGALASGGGRISPTVPKLDPDDLQLTVAIEGDYKLAVYVVNPVIDVADLDADKIKLFDLGDRIQQIHIRKDTIVGIDEATDEYKKIAGDFHLRDDEKRAESIADFLGSYYFQSQRVARIATRRITGLVWPGQLLTEINPDDNPDDETDYSQQINAVVTEVSLRLGVFNGTSYSAPEMLITTSRGEIDPLQIFPTLNYGT